MIKMNIEEIGIEDKDYPERLRNIKKPPKKIYIIGNKEILNSKGIAVIGSRDCTNEGRKNARVFSANIAKAGFTVISGMAKGIDAAAHQRMYGCKPGKLLQCLDVDQITYFQKKIKKYIIK